MDYRELINHIMEQDQRNQFGEMTFEEVEELPEELRGFYLAGNPEDVEIQLKDFTSIKLYPYQQLLQLQEEYQPSENAFVFATLEGDPIMLMDGEVYGGLHGTKEECLELRHNSFDEFLKYIVEEMKKRN